MIDTKLMAAELEIDEDYIGRMYQCSAGANTIGIGFNLDTETMPLSVARDLLMHGILQRMEHLQTFNWFHTLNDTRQRVILNMAFNLGVSGMLKFKGMISAIGDGDYERAADEMVDSIWYGQVGGRSVRLVAMMREG